MKGNSEKRAQLCQHQDRKRGPTLSSEDLQDEFTSDVIRNQQQPAEQEANLKSEGSEASSESEDSDNGSLGMENPKLEEEVVGRKT